MLTRNVRSYVREALADTPVVVLNGPRQSGKTTLARELATDSPFLTFDDAAILAAAADDPQGFVAGLSSPVVIDEVQRLPELFVAIKASVDRDRRPGRFLLTGSTNVLLLPRLSDSLAGRMEVVTLWPLSQGEIAGRRETFIDAVFGDQRRLPEVRGEPRQALVRRALTGGFPEVLGRASESRRTAWFDAYLDTIIQRDLRDLANVEGLTDLARLLGILAARSPGQLNTADISRTAGIPATTLRRYLALLEAIYVIRLVHPWSGNTERRLVRAPRLTFTDSGVFGRVRGVDIAMADRDPNVAGPLLETFVISELRKQIGWSQTRPRILFFRTHTGQEVDVVLERPGGDVVGIEVKSSATVDSRDRRGLEALRESVGPRFRRGIILYTGEQALPFGDGIEAWPMNSLWEVAENPPSSG